MSFPCELNITSAISQSHRMLCVREREREREREGERGGGRYGVPERERGAEKEEEGGAAEGEGRGSTSSRVHDKNRSIQHTRVSGVGFSYKDIRQIRLD